MKTKNPLKRRNISWKTSTDEMAEKLAGINKMKVSAMLEQLILDEAKSPRIKPGARSTFLDLIADAVDAKIAQLKEELRQKKDK